MSQPDWAAVTTAVFFRPIIHQTPARATSAPPPATGRSGNELESPDSTGAEAWVIGSGRPVTGRSSEAGPSGSAIAATPSVVVDVVVDGTNPVSSPSPRVVVVTVGVVVVVGQAVVVVSGTVVVVAGAVVVVDGGGAVVVVVVGGAVAVVVVAGGAVVVVVVAGGAVVVVVVAGGTVVVVVL
jgi:hypothetical protein